MIVLAPMEGVIDVHMRHLLTGIGGYDRCVTEFIRISDQLLPRRVYYRLCPELRQGGQVNGVPVYVQLLGADPTLMAESAALAAELGAPGIDLNFGCPSKTVNRNNGGAVLLQYPERVNQIIAQVRQAVPKHIPVTAKLRLGYADTSLALDNAQAAEAGGAHSITVHARTQREGYRPPAHWHWLARIREHISIELIANGEIWTSEDARRCHEVSGCQAIMLGRGAVARPDLAMQIRSQDTHVPYDWSHTLDLLKALYESMARAGHQKALLPRIKQWLAALRRSHPQAGVLFEQMKKQASPEAAWAFLELAHSQEGREKRSA